MGVYYSHSLLPDFTAQQFVYEWEYVSQFVITRDCSQVEIHLPTWKLYFESKLLFLLYHKWIHEQLRPISRKPP